MLETATTATESRMTLHSERSAQSQDRVNQRRVTSSGVGSLFSRVLRGGAITIRSLLDFLLDEGSVGFLCGYEVECSDARLKVAGNTAIPIS
jgi:hypothetical protein